MQVCVSAVGRVCMHAGFHHIGLYNNDRTTMKIMYPSHKATLTASPYRLLFYMRAHYVPTRVRACTYVHVYTYV